MAPWFRFLTHEWEKLLTDHDRQIVEGDPFDGVGGRPKQLLEVVANRAQKNPVMGLASVGRRVNLLHSTWVQGDTNVLGINGFAVTSPVKSVAADHCVRGLVDPKLVTEAAEQRVPSVSQLLMNASDRDKCLETFGDSTDRKVEDFIDSEAVVCIPPVALQHMASWEGKPLAADVMKAVLTYIVTWVRTSKASSDSTELTWGRLVGSLWIMAQGWAKVVKLNDPKEEDEVDEVYLDLIGKLGDVETRNAKVPPKSNPDPDDSDSSDEDSDQEARKGTALNAAIRKHQELSGRMKNSDLPPIRMDTGRSDGRAAKRTKRGDNTTERAPAMARRDKDDPSSSSSSSSESEESDPDQPATPRRQRKKEPKDSSPESLISEGSEKKRKRKGSTDYNKMLALAIDQLAFNSRATAKREKKKASLLANWTDPSVRLFHLLSAQHWDEDGLPKLTPFAKKLTADKKATNSLQMVVEQSRNWEGAPSKNGMAGFLTRGFLAEDISTEPSGFTVFMMVPIDFITSSSKSHRIQHLQEVFGDGKLTEESLKEFSKEQYHVPGDYNQAADQLKSAIRLLDILTGERSVASDGYRRGLRFLVDHRRRFNQALSDDSSFLVRYLYLLDGIFQAFCEKLLIHGAGKTQPLHRCRHLDEFQVRKFDSVMDNFGTLGQRPNLPLPRNLAPRTSRDATEKSQPKEKAQGVKEKTAKRKDEPWMTTNPSPVTEWKIPSGKTFQDFFGPTSRGNREGFPTVKHHSRDKDTKMCLSYQVSGECKHGSKCFNAHIDPNKMSNEDRKKAGDRFAAIYH